MFVWEYLPFSLCGETESGKAQGNLWPPETRSGYLVLWANCGGDLSEEIWLKTKA